MSQHKKDLRAKYKTLRHQLNDDTIQELSLDITNLILSLPIWNKTYFHVFLPIVKQKEIDTELILHLLSGKDKEIVISKANFETRVMSHYLLTDNTRIKKNQYDIPEPVDGLEVPSSKIDVVFVPLLAFDQKGNRVGYGKGFYDKFLADCKPETIKIGLSFFEAETLIEGIFEDDIALNYCVTPKKIYSF